MIRILRETHEAPASVARRLEIAGGRNRFGEANYRAVWGWSRLGWIGGKWTDHDSEGAVVREVMCLRREPKYTPHNRWHIERWLAPETYGSPREWYAATMERESDTSLFSRGTSGGFVNGLAGIGGNSVAGSAGAAGGTGSTNRGGGDTGAANDAGGSSGTSGARISASADARIGIATAIPALGPYPTRGEYEHCFTLEGPRGEFVQLTPTVAEYIARAIEAGRHTDAAHRRASIDAREAQADRDYDAYTWDVLSSEDAAFDGAPFATVL